MGRRRRRVRHMSQCIRRMLSGLQCTRRCLSDCVGSMQTSISPTLHFQMDRSTECGTTKMPHVSTRLGHSTVGYRERFKQQQQQRRQRKREQQLINANNNNGDKDESETKQQINFEKYWAQRYRLFFLFDKGIQLDGDGWFSITPERIAQHHAQRFMEKGLKNVVDLFSGFGGNSIQFAKAGCHVTGVEKNDERIRMSKHNADIYQVVNSIDFVCDDVYTWLKRQWKLLRDESKQPKPKIDGVFISPPWGGPDYLNSEWFDVSSFRTSVEGARRITPNVAIMVPRNIDEQNVFDTFGTCELEANYLGDKHKTCTIYFGALMSHDTDKNVAETLHMRTTAGEERWKQFDGENEV